MILNYVDANVEKLVVENGIREIGEDVCRGHLNLKEVVLPNSVMKIHAGAFARCSNLEKVTLSSSLTYIGNAAFASCKKLKKISPLPNTLSYIGNEAFFNCNLLEMKLDLPNTLMYLGEDAFSFCYEISEVRFNSKLKVISRCAFQNCKGLKRVYLHEGLEEIRRYAFDHVIDVENLELPHTIKFLGENSLNIEKLHYIYLPNSIEIMENECLPNTYRIELEKGFNITLKNDGSPFTKGVFIKGTYKMEKDGFIFNVVSEEDFRHAKVALLKAVLKARQGG